MKRKVVKHGPSTFIISLPAKWVKRNNVQKGDSLEVTPEADSLTVSIQTGDTKKRLERDVSGLKSTLVLALVTHAYRQGYDEVALRHDNVEHLERLQALLPDLLGYVMLQQDDEECTITSLSKEIDITFDEALANTWDTLQEMVSGLHEYMQTDVDWLDAVRLQARDVRKLTNYCYRQLSKGAVSAHEKSDYISVLEETHDLATRIPEIGEHLITAGRPEDLKQSLNDLGRTLAAARTFYETRDADDAEQLLAMQETVHETLAGIEKDLNSEARLAAHEIQDLADALRHLCLAHLFMDGSRETGREGERGAAAIEG